MSRTERKGYRIKHRPLPLAWIIVGEDGVHRPGYLSRDDAEREAQAIYSAVSRPDEGSVTT